MNKNGDSPDIAIDEVQTNLEISEGERRRCRFAQNDGRVRQAMP